MGNAKIFGFAVSGLFALALLAYLPPTSAQIITSRASAASDTNSKDVTVVNTPLPVSIDNSAVPAQQSGAWTVGISGIPTVKVDPGSPVPVQVQVNEPARQPFFCQLQMVIPDGTGSTYAIFRDVTSAAAPCVVPAGKRGVVEFVSLYAQMPYEQRLTFTRLSGGNANNQFIQVQATDTANTALVSASQPMTMYLDSGNGLTLYVGRTSPQGSQLVDAYVTGHYVDLP